MTEQEIEAITGGYHGDPFAVLGPHASGSESKAEWEIRTLQPQAKTVDAVIGGSVLPMQRVHPTGLFSVVLASRPDHYQLHITDFAGHVSDIDDAYRFQPVITDFDLHLHSEGTNYEGYNSFGAHPVTIDGVAGTRFAVWAPNAIIVSVVGNFNDWDTRRHPMRARTGGVWEIFIPGVSEGMPYKYSVKSKFRGYSQMKSDPYGFEMETPPKSASIVVDLEKYQWNDQAGLRGKCVTEDELREQRISFAFGNAPFGSESITKESVRLASKRISVMC